MKLNTLEKVYLCLKYEVPELTMDEDLRKKPCSPSNACSRSPANKDCNLISSHLQSPQWY